MSDLVQYNACGNLRVRKYKREVFYDNLWNTDPILLESRGHVLDENDQLVARPFAKLFNYKENNTEYDPDIEVVAVEKVNGFMFHVTSHGDEFIQGTTGSLDSPFVTLAKENMKKHNVNYDAIKEITDEDGEPITFIFEIKDNEKDPHIIDDEEDGVYLLGARVVSSGILFSQEKLDNWAKRMNAKRPNWWIKKFGEVLDEVVDVKHEGFVIYHSAYHYGILKLKSPYYISKKSLMRKHPTMVYSKNYKSLVDEEYYPIIEKVRNTVPIAIWSVMSEQQRGEYFNIIYRSALYSTNDLVKYITNHPKISYNQKKDDLKLRYDYDGGYFVAEIDLYYINEEFLRLDTYGQARGAGDTVDQAIQNLYINVFAQFGQYEYKEECMKSETGLAYYSALKNLAVKKHDNILGDLKYFYPEYSCNVSKELL